MYYIEPKTMASIVKMVSDKTISRGMAKDLMEIYFCIGLIKTGRASGIRIGDDVWYPPNQL